MTLKARKCIDIALVKRRISYLAKVIEAIYQVETNSNSDKEVRSALVKQAVEIQSSTIHRLMDKIINGEMEKPLTTDELRDMALDKIIVGSPSFEGSYEGGVGKVTGGRVYTSNSNEAIEVPLDKKVWNDSPSTPNEANMVDKDATFRELKKTLKNIKKERDDKAVQNGIKKAKNLVDMMPAKKATKKVAKKLAR